MSVVKERRRAVRRNRMVGTGLVIVLFYATLAFLFSRGR
jgi:hypothetical protein